MWFKNLQIYKISDEWFMPFQEIVMALNKRPLLPVPPGAEFSYGWIDPQGIGESPAYTLSGSDIMISLGRQERILPASVVKAEVKRRMAGDNYPYRKENKRDLKELVRFELLPKAFVRETVTRAWIDADAHLLVIDSPSQAKAEDLIEVLRHDLVGLNVEPIWTLFEAQYVIDSWAVSSSATGPFDLEEYLEVTGEESVNVRYKNVGPACPAMLDFAQAGSSVSKIGLTWRDEISFVLTRDLQIKKIKSHAIIDNDPNNEVDNTWNSEMIIMTSQLSLLIKDLIDQLSPDSK